MDVSRFLHPRGLACPDSLPAGAEAESGRPRGTWPSRETAGPSVIPP